MCFTAKGWAPCKGQSFEIRHQARSSSRTHKFFVPVEALPELSGNFHPGSTAYNQRAAAPGGCVALCAGVLRVAKEMAKRRLANRVGEPRGKQHRSGVRPTAREVSSCGYPLDQKKKKKKKTWWRFPLSLMEARHWECQGRHSYRQTPE